MVVDLGAEARTVQHDQAAQHIARCIRQRTDGWQIVANRSEQFCSDAAQAARLACPSPGQVPPAPAVFHLRDTDRGRVL